MSAPFVYIQGEDARDKFLAKGFTLLKSDEQNHLYVFTSNDLYTLTFETDNNPNIVLSDMLTFTM